MKPYLAQIRSNLLLMSRDRTVLFFNYFFPLLFFVIFAFSFGGAKNPGAIGQVVDMVLVLGVLGSGFFGAGMRAVQDRESNVLRRFKVTPVGAAPLVVASLVSGLVSYLPSVVLVLLLAHFWTGMPFPAHLFDFFVFISLGALAFRAMGTIVASVVNSPQENQIITQILYMSMLFLSGTTFPLEFFPHWLQVVSQFIPATYLFHGMQSLFLANGTLIANLLAAVSLLITLCVGSFLAVKLFRWEKEEKISNRAKAWVLIVMLPFFLMGAYQSRSGKNLQQDRIMARNLRRNQPRLFQNARIFVGDGNVIQNGAVLVRNGKIDKVFPAPVEPKLWQAEVVDVSGKTLLPGLIDMHVHLSAPGGVYENVADYARKDALERELAAYLFSGITAVRSTGDPLNRALQARAAVESGLKTGAELFVCGPMFTAKGGYGTEYASFLPSTMRAAFERETVRTPVSAAEAKKDVEDLKQAGVNGIKAILESGQAGMLFNHLDAGTYQAVVIAAARVKLPVATHTGNQQDVEEAIQAGTSTIEHGSMRDLIPEKVFREMAGKGIAYDPTLSVAEALENIQRHEGALLDGSLTQQAAPRSLLNSTRKALAHSELLPYSDMDAARAFKLAKQNLKAAWQAGVTLITGSDAGNMLVIHGPTVQRELELWVQAGIPPAIALKAATYNAARALQAGQMGLIREGYEANLILVEGNPLEDISSIERITYVLFHGENIDRSRIFKEEGSD